MVAQKERLNLELCQELLLEALNAHGNDDQSNEANNQRFKDGKAEMSLCHYEKISACWRMNHSKPMHEHDDQTKSDRNWEPLCVGIGEYHGTDDGRNKVSAKNIHWV